MKIKIQICLILLFTLLLFLACNRNTTAVDDEKTAGSSVLVDVRAMFHDQLVIYSSTHVKDYPRNPVDVDLKIYDETKSEFIILKTKTTDDKGFVVFDSLKVGKYQFVPRKNDEICEIIPKSLETYSNSKRDTVIIGVGYNWNFRPCNFDVAVDTNSTGVSQLHKFLFVNSGLRDTLNCNFDTSQVPDWINLEFSTNVFPPKYSNVFDYYIQLEYKNNEVPVESLPLTFSVNIQHQFGSFVINFQVDIKE